MRELAIGLGVLVILVLWWAWCRNRSPEQRTSCGPYYIVRRASRERARARAQALAAFRAAIARGEHPEADGRPDPDA